MRDTYRKMRWDISSAILNCSREKEDEPFLSISDVIKTVEGIEISHEEVKEDLIAKINKFAKRGEDIHVSLALGEVALFFMTKENEAIN